MGVGADLYMCDVVVKKFTFAISSPDEFLSDSMSSLETLRWFKIELDLVLKIIKDYTHLANASKTIEFCWIPSHINISGNERADIAAKAALCLPVTSMKLPASEFLPHVSKLLKSGRISGIVLRTINFTPSTQLLAHLITINSSHVVMLWFWTEWKLVTLA